MKKSAVFMNIGRGNTVVEDDLVKALKEKIIAGAVLDVFSKEPLSESSELWDLPNVLMTPHCADHVPDSPELAFNVFMDNLERYAESKPMRNICDKRKGY